MRKVAFVLTPVQMAELEDAAQNASDADVRLRARALLHLAGDDGYRSAARAVAVNESAVRKWHAAYRAEGVEGLRTRERPGRPAKLTQTDRERIEQALAQPPQTVGFTGDTWTARSLNQYLQLHSETRVSDWTIWAVMRDMQRAWARTAPLATNGHTLSHQKMPELKIRIIQEDETMPTQPPAWDAWRELMMLRQQMDRLFEDRWTQTRASAPAPSSALFLPIDVYSDEDAVVVLASLPGLKAEDVDIVLQGDTVTIQGEAHPPSGNVQWAVQERPYGKFSRSLTLNVPVDMAKAEAEFENGILTLRLPKAESAKPRQIQVKAK